MLLKIKEFFKKIFAAIITAYKTKKWLQVVSLALAIMIVLGSVILAITLSGKDDNPSTSTASSSIVSNDSSSIVDDASGESDSVTPNESETSSPDESDRVDSSEQDSSSQDNSSSVKPTPPETSSSSSTRPELPETSSSSSTRPEPPETSSSNSSTQPEPPETSSSSSSTAIPEVETYECLIYTLSRKGEYYKVAHTTADHACKIKNLVVPETHEGKPVMRIDNAGFYNCAAETIVIPDCIEAMLGSKPFEKCTSLKSVTFGKRITNISQFAFDGCVNLESVTLGDGMAVINDHAFRNCPKFTKFIVSSGNQTFKAIDGNLYSKDGKKLVKYAIGKSATSFTIEASVEEIAIGAFRYCDNLNEITFADTTSNWFLPAYTGATSGTEILASDLANKATAANYLKVTHAGKLWKKQ